MKMSLFPAYNKESTAETEIPLKQNADVANQQWLKNSSFAETLCISNELVNKETNLNHQKNKKVDGFKSGQSLSGGSKAKKKKKYETKPLDTESEYYKIEKSGYKEFLSVSTISWPAAPKYKSSFNLMEKAKKLKKQKLIRYFQNITEETVGPDNTEKQVDATAVHKDDNFTGFVQEQDISQKTASYNQHLSQYPCDVQMWLEYIKFQDIVYQFEKTYRKGSIAKAQRVLAERKLSILDKALSINSDCELLHRERLDIVASTFPADELQLYLKDFVDKNKGNIILWQGYIEATQCSMSHCTTPIVLDLYTKCLSTLHYLRRATVLEKHLIEENILRMLYQCGLFLKQSGLFENLWMLLKMYLELNLSPNEKNKFELASVFDEKQLVELEEVIFTSQLPLHELWLRTEKLRESCHWLPYTANDDCEDPQRLVFAEDVAELIHPITNPENIFKLTATIFSLLKVPLLPCRHTTMQDLGLDYVPWSFDSIEPLLSIFFSLYPVKLNNENILKEHKLAVGPQYLKPMPGQEEYLKFILSIMKSCSQCLTGDDKLAVTIWWFRFQRLLITLDKNRTVKLSDDIKKQMKKNIKEVLKLSENRQNVLYYLEYALLEKELGHPEACMNIIDIALKMGENISFLSNEWSLSHGMWCFLHRQHVELLLGDNCTNANTDTATLLLCELVLQKKINVLSEVNIQQAKDAFRKITSKLIQDNPKTLQPSSNFLPDFLTEWIMCNAWFIYLNEGLDEFVEFLKSVVDSLNSIEKSCLQKEILYEFYIAILFKHCQWKSNSNAYNFLDKILFKAIDLYPNNLFILSILERKQSFIHSFGPPWWKIQTILLKSGRALCILFAVIILNQHLSTSKIIVDSITGEICGLNINIRNRLYSLFKRLTSSNMPIRRCGLLWRLYLQFVYTYYSPEVCRNVYYAAVEECPWLKALYIDAAIYIPAELPQIQDLIIEKQLRLHVTPEELDVLRN